MILRCIKRKHVIRMIFHFGVFRAGPPAVARSSGRLGQGAGEGARVVQLE